MREIKFRAWQREDKKMLCEKDFVGIVINGETFRDEYGDLFIGTYDKVLMQYTGLKDKNGKEIYEGDIVKVDISAFGERVGVIEFFEEEFCVKVDEGYYSCGMRYDFPEVIGNIYENPELLK